VRIVLLGCPGAGKGKQAKSLRARLGVPQISTGDMLREAVQSGSQLGKEVAAIMDAGELVSGDIIMAIVKERLQAPDCAHGYIFDGIPRTLEQADSMRNAGIVVDTVINLAINDEAIVERMAGRWMHAASGRTYHTQFNPPKDVGFDDITGEPLTQRKDDQEPVVRNRLAVYHTQTAPLIQYYQSESESAVYHQVSAEGPVEEVTQRLLAILLAASSK